MQQTFSMLNERLGGIFIPHMNLQGLLSIISELTPSCDQPAFCDSDDERSSLNSLHFLLPSIWTCLGLEMKWVGCIKNCISLLSIEHLPHNLHCPRIQTTPFTRGICQITFNSNTPDSWSQVPLFHHFENFPLLVPQTLK